MSRGVLQKYLPRTIYQEHAIRFWGYTMRFTIILFLLASAINLRAADTPNVIFIVGDDQAWTDYGFMGHPTIQTPHLDKLASESLTFKHGYVPTSLCRASLATMITGLYPHQHKITSNDPPLPQGVPNRQVMKHPGYLRLRQEMVALFEQSPSLPKLLAKKGYVSHQSGKWWEGNACRCGGFDEGMTHGDPAKGGRHGDIGLQIGRQGLKPVFEFIKNAQAAKKPFYAWYAPMMPHTPHNPPERLLKKYRSKTDSIHVAKYWAMCEWFDETVGDMLKFIDDQQLRDNTIVIYLHDNGWIQDTKSGRYAPRSKRSPYDTGTRTPIMIRWPGKVTAGMNENLAHSVDLVPTVLAAVGLKPTTDMQGINLLDANTVSQRKTVYGEIFEHNAIDIYKPAKNLQYRWIIHEGKKLIVPNPALIKHESVQLFNLMDDPFEKTDLSQANPKLVADLTVKLNQFWSIAD